GIDRDHEVVAAILAPLAGARVGLVEGGGLLFRTARERYSQTELGRDGRVVPLRAVVRPQHLDQLGRAVPRHLGDDPVAVLGSARPPPAELAHARSAAGRIEAPAAVRDVRTAEESADGIGVPGGTVSGRASYDGSSAGASFACASRSSCASAS